MTPEQLSGPSTGTGGPPPAEPPKPIPPGQPGPDHPIDLPQKPEPDPPKHV